MMGKFIGTVTSLQQRCTGLTGYRLRRHENIGKIFNVVVMDYEVSAQGSNYVVY